MARINDNITFYLYCITETASRVSGPCKIGVAANLRARLSQLQCGNWRELGIAWQVAFKDRNNALDVEAHILAKLRPSAYGHPGPRRRLKSEWVEATPDEASAAGRELAAIFLEEEAA